MKKLIAAALAVTAALSLSACQQTDLEKRVEKLEEETQAAWPLLDNMNDLLIFVEEDLTTVEHCLDAMFEHFRGFGGIVVVGGSLHVADSIRCSSFGDGRVR